MRRPVLAVLAMMALFAGCGAHARSVGLIPAEDDATLHGDLRILRAHCGHPPTPEAVRAVRTMVLVYRVDGPDGIYRTGTAPRAENLRTLLTNAAHDLDRCGDRLDARILAAALKGRQI